MQRLSQQWPCYSRLEFLNVDQIMNDGGHVYSLSKGALSFRIGFLL